MALQPVSEVLGSQLAAESDATAATRCTRWSVSLLSWGECRVLVGLWPVERIWTAFCGF